MTDSTTQADGDAPLGLSEVEWLRLQHALEQAALGKARGPGGEAAAEPYRALIPKLRSMLAPEWEYAVALFGDIQALEPKADLQAVRDEVHSEFDDAVYRRRKAGDWELLPAQATEASDGAQEAAKAGKKSLRLIPTVDFEDRIGDFELKGGPRGSLEEYLNSLRLAVEDSSRHSWRKVPLGQALRGYDSWTTYGDFEHNVIRVVVDAMKALGDVLVPLNDRWDGYADGLDFGAISEAELTAYSDDQPQVTLEGQRYAFAELPKDRSKENWG